MGRLGCTADGTLDDSKFNEPMPWIGLYVAAASAICAIGMVVDVLHGIRYRKFWFPCKYFALNATTLTLIGVAVKLSVDLNSSMPRRNDQLAKLSSTTFICTAIGSFMPSLGTMEKNELLMNLMALGILIITVIVNVGIQLGTGVIYVFFIEHVLIMFFMLILFAILISSALTIPATKIYFDMKYSKKYALAIKESKDASNASLVEKLKGDLVRYWMMAHTSNPQFVMGRLATCTGSGAICFLSAVTLAEATLRCYLMPLSFKFCNGPSDYKWSTNLILIAQTVAVGGGTIAPACRWFLVIKFRCPRKAKSAGRTEFKVEDYWIRKLKDWKECPLVLRNFSRKGRKVTHNIKDIILNFCIQYQKVIVALCKSFRLVSVYFAMHLLIGWRCCKKLIKLVNCNTTISDDDIEPEPKAKGRMDLSHFVLHLEGEEGLVDMMMECDNNTINHWIRMGKKKQPKYLIRLLEKLNMSLGFTGVKEFDSCHVPSLESGEPPNCWTLPVVTLASIAIATSNTDFHLVKKLMHSVHEGLKYMRIIENNLETRRNLTTVRKAAEIVWHGVDLCYKWLDIDLRDIAAQGKSPYDVISDLSNIAKQKFVESRKEDAFSCFGVDPSTWPIEALAANSMYRICQTLLLSPNIIGTESSKTVFQKASAMITDIIGACLTNLQQVILMKCHRSTIEDREMSVEHAIFLLGKSEKILEILNSQPLPGLDPDQLACIDDWRASSVQKGHLCCDPYSIYSETDSRNSSDFYLTIDS